MSKPAMSDQGPRKLPINGVLDLHTFRPQDVKALVPDYLEECRKRGILQVRIIHGKGIGVLRETVHSVLKKLPYVESYSLAPGNAGGWGATVAALKPDAGPPGPRVAGTDTRA